VAALARAWDAQRLADHERSRQREEQRERVQIRTEQRPRAADQVGADASLPDRPREQAVSSTLVGIGVPSKYFTLPLAPTATRR
jgi:hypothetical protein